ncbi:T9SS type A sorting domain-containing protein [bacterium]|nr:T9SS type A sorting domain-containing protein [bacterium]
MSKQDFRIRENGEEVKDFTLWCPDPAIRCASSIVMVADVSGSMRGEPMMRMKEAMHWLIDAHDGLLDEAALVSAGETTEIVQGMTALKPFLYDAIDGLFASGSSAVFNGCWAGMMELINNGVNSCRAVILFSDGLDNASNHTMNELIATANRNRIRIFTIGTGRTIKNLDLEVLALLTGGRYYENPREAQMIAILKEISVIIFQGFQECVITYERDCADGTMRSVDFQLRDFCGGNDEKSKKYRAPLDSISYWRQHLRIPEIVSEPVPTVTLPLELTAVPKDSILYPFTLQLTASEPRRPLYDVTIPQGSPIENAQIRLSKTGDGLLFSLEEEVAVRDTGRLLDMHFSTAGIADSSHFPLRTEVHDHARCVGTIVEEGGYMIVPRLLPRIDGPDTVYGCHSSAVTLSANTGFSEYLWSNGDRGRTIEVHQSGEYWVQVKDVFGDPLRSSSVTVVIRPERNVWIEHDGPLEVCNPETVTLRVGGDTEGAQIYWNGNSWARAQFNVGATGMYWAEVVDAEGCRHLTDTVMATVNTPPLHLNVQNDTMICAGDLLELRVLEDYPRYGWSTGDSTQSILVLGEYYRPYEVTAWDSAGCRSVKKNIRVLLYPGETLELFPSNLVYVCDSASAQVAASGNFVSWEWSSGERTPFINITSPGQYILTATDTNGCSVIDTVFARPAEMLPPPRIGTPQGTVICTNGSLPLDGGAGYIAWRWSTGDTTRSILVSDSGSYYVDVTAHGGCVYRSQPVYIFRRSSPNDGIQVQGDTLLCPGETIKLIAPPGQQYYFWTTGETTSSILVRDGGHYAVTYVTPEGCEDTAPTIFLYEPEARFPVISRAGDQLRTQSGAVSYQWYWEDGSLAGETDSVLQVSRTGRYAVVIVDSCGRNLRSEDFIVSVLEVPTAIPSTPQLAVYPDPARNMQNLHISGCQGPMEVTLHDLLGRQRLSRHVPHNGTITLDISALPRGVYILRLAHGQGSMTRRVVLE